MSSRKWCMDACAPQKPQTPKLQNTVKDRPPIMSASECSPVPVCVCVYVRRCVRVCVFVCVFVFVFVYVFAYVRMCVVVVVVVAWEG